MRKELDDRLNADRRLSQIAEKIRAGKADFRDTAEYSDIVSRHIAAVMQDNIGEINSPLGKQFVCEALLKDHYTAINDVLGEVQAAVDEQNGIHIKPKQAAYPEERVHQVAHSLEDPTVPKETIRRRAGAPVENVAKSMHDDYIKENAKLRSSAGLKCFIVRTTDGKCCAWCSAMAGRYDYETAPDDVFRRHDNCGCSTIYENGRQRQDVWSKKTWEVPDGAKKQHEPVRLDYGRAKAVESQNLQYVGLTSGANSGIIKARGFTPLSDSRVVPVLRKESQQWIAALNSEEIRAIKKYTKNSGDPADDKFYARLNAMLRGEIPEDETLLYYSDLISGALRKNQLKHDIVCYRSLDINPYVGASVGDILVPYQFLSTSVTHSGALKGRFEMTIRVKSGTIGAYIEPLSLYPKQREFLLDKDCAYRVISIKENSIELEVMT